MRKRQVELAYLDGGTRPVGAVYGIGRNVAAHARELGNPVPDEPLVFLKAVTSIRPLDAPGRVAFPDAVYHHEAEVVVVVGAPVPLGACPGWEVVEGLALGLDLTRRDVQRKLKAQGLPWTEAKSFWGSAPVGPIVPLDRFPAPDRVGFRFEVGGELRQEGALDALRFSIPELLARLAALQPLQPGDLVFTGTPAGVGPIRVGDRFRLSFVEPHLCFDGVL